jgi:hypothetical protein
MFAGELLRRLGLKLGDSEEVGRFQWEKEIANLSVPILDAVRVDVGTLGKGFEDAKREFIGCLGAFAVRDGPLDTEFSISNLEAKN